MFGGLFSGNQPAGSVVTTERGVFSNISEAIRGSNPGTGPGVYHDAAGRSYTTAAEAAEADYIAEQRGWY